MFQAVTCPFCGEAGEVFLAEVESQVFVQDCEVCCHPWQVVVRVSVGGDVDVAVDRA